MLKAPSEEEINQYLLPNGNVFHKILEDIENLAEPSVLTVSRLVKKLYLISSVLEFMAGNTDEGAIERAAIKDRILKLSIGTSLSGTQEFKDQWNQVKDRIRTYATSHCEALTQRLSAPIEVLPQEPIIQEEPPQGIAPALMQHSAIFSPPPPPPLVLPDPEKFYQNALKLAYEVCGNSRSVELIAAQKTAANIEVITSILDLMVLRAQGFMDDEEEYERNITLLLARLSKANAQLDQPKLLTQTPATHWIIPFTILFFSLAIIPIISAIFNDISPENQKRFQP